MKNIIIIIIFFFNQETYSQTTRVNLGVDSAALEVSDTTKGVLISRMTLTQRDNILNPKDGLLIYNLTDSCFSYFNGINWINFGCISSSSGCPVGFVDVNGQFSIEINERPAQTWYDAVKICSALKARLCTFGEYYYACQAGLSLQNTTGNWEWIDDSGGSGTNAKLIGFADCTNNSSSNPGTTPYSFRCCCTNK